MSRKILFVVSALLLSTVLVGASLVWARAQEGVSPEDCQVVKVVLEPIQPGETSSQVVETDCADEPAETVFLEPLQPDELIPPTIEDEGDLVNGIVHGPSTESGYRCVIFLEPIQPGQRFSEASEPVCSRGSIESVHGVSLSSSFLITRFYDNTNYGTLLVEYFGSSACSSTVSYGVASLPSNLNNKFASGRAYSNCDHINVYDFSSYGDPSYACGANCSSFFALNDEVSSWTSSD